MAACTQKHSHVCKHADNGEGNRGKALCVHHVWIIPAPGITKDVASLSAVTSVKRQLINKLNFKKTIYTD